MRSLALGATLTVAILSAFYIGSQLDLFNTNNKIDVLPTINYMQTDVKVGGEVPKANDIKQQIELETKERVKQTEIRLEQSKSEQADQINEEIPSMSLENKVNAEDERIEKINQEQAEKLETKLSDIEQIFDATSTKVDHVTEAKNLDQSMVTVSVSFNECTTASKTTTFYESAPLFVGYDVPNKKSRSANLRPDLSQSQVILGNAEKSDWGIVCNQDNYCTPGAKCMAGQTYLGLEQLDCTTATTAIYFDQKIDATELKTKTNVQLVNIKSEDWVLNTTGVLGLAPGSMYLETVLNDYNFSDDNDGFEFSFNYDISDKDHRYAADKADAFSISLMAFGQNKDLIQNPNNLKNVKQAAGVQWNLPEANVLVDDTPITGINTKTGYIVNSGNEYIAVSSTLTDNVHQNIIDAVNKALGYTKGVTTAKDIDFDDIKKYFTIQFKAADGSVITLNNLLKDIAWFDEGSNDLQYSIVDIQTWIDKGIVPMDAELAFGRQFVLNTYLNFQVKKNGVYQMQVGQLMDMGKITPLERILLLCFGLLIVSIILIVLFVKVCKSKGQAARKDNYNLHEA